jgi:hypothetical protein
MGITGGIPHNGEQEAQADEAVLFQSRKSLTVKLPSMAVKDLNDEGSPSMTRKLDEASMKCHDFLIRNITGTSLR